MREASGARLPDDAQLPAWWKLIPTSFAQRCSYVFLPNWRLSAKASDLRKVYIERFGEEAVGKRIPLANWRRADFCWQKMPNDLPLIDIGSGLGEFVNLCAIANQAPVASVDVRDWDLWFDASGRVERIHKSILDLGEAESRDVVCCFEVLEHLPPERLQEAVSILRRLAIKGLFISVPFMEPPPGSKGHKTRFTDRELLEFFPDAQFTVLGKSDTKLYAWIFGEISI